MILLIWICRDWEAVFCNSGLLCSSGSAKQVKGESLIAVNQETGLLLARELYADHVNGDTVLKQITWFWDYGALTSVP